MHSEILVEVIGGLVTSIICGALSGAWLFFRGMKKDIDCAWQAIRKITAEIENLKNEKE